MFRLDEESAQRHLAAKRAKEASSLSDMTSIAEPQAVAAAADDDETPNDVGAEDEAARQDGDDDDDIEDEEEQFPDVEVKSARKRTSVAATDGAF